MGEFYKQRIFLLNAKQVLFRQCPLFHELCSLIIPLAAILGNVHCCSFSKTKDHRPKPFLKKILTMIYGRKCGRIGYINHKTEVRHFSCTEKVMVLSQWWFTEGLLVDL